MEYEDREIACDCGDVFMFTARDQEFYAEKGFADPKRCKPCRQRKKEQHMYDTETPSAPAPDAFGE